MDLPLFCGAAVIIMILVCNTIKLHLLGQHISILSVFSVVEGP